jgi:hypothetical protein
VMSIAMIHFNMGAFFEALKSLVVIGHVTQTRGQG